MNQSSEFCPAFGAECISEMTSQIVSQVADINAPATESRVFSIPLPGVHSCFFLDVATHVLVSAL